MRGAYFNGLTIRQTITELFRKVSVQTNGPSHICVTAQVTEVSYAVVLMQLRNNYLRQGCESEAGKEEHNYAERRIGIFDWHTCFRLCLPTVPETG